MADGEETNPQFEAFSSLLNRLLSVPRSDVRELLDEHEEKKQQKRAAKAQAASAEGEGG